MDKYSIQVLLELKLCCAHLMKDPSKNNVCKFVEIISNNSNVIMQYLSEYCLRPTIISLQINNLR